MHSLLKAMEAHAALTPAIARRRERDDRPRGAEVRQHSAARGTDETLTKT